MTFTFKQVFFIAQRSFFTMALVVFYCLFIGFAFLFGALYNCFTFRKARANKETFWREPLGYEPDMDDCLRQS